MGLPATFFLARTQCRCGEGG